MSIIEQQVKELREIANCYYGEIKNHVSAIEEAADTIEALSAKVAAANMERSERYHNGGWIPCEERLLEEGQRVLATHESGLNPERQVIEHVFKNGCFALNWDMDTQISSPTFGQRYAGKVIAWQPLPEPYHP